MPRKLGPPGQTVATYLHQKDVKALRRIARQENTTLSALIRETVREAYGLN